MMRAALANSLSDPQSCDSLEIVFGDVQVQPESVFEQFCNRVRNEDTPKYTKKQEAAKTVSLLRQICAGENHGGYVTKPNHSDSFLECTRYRLSWKGTNNQ